MQVHGGSTGGADVGQRTVGRAGEMQEVAEGVFDALQWHFIEVEEQLVEGLKVRTGVLNRTN
ncbi:hypothetical protein PPUN12996_06640 [Pseudomonas putida]|nr:hypothetical protein PPS11_15126 [Pseudomonas putida S11]GLO28608.1 hypothetical protein PPUN12996_06640 [Pseudomonas putida]